ncbi:MAG: DUF2961 domain-containing protein [Abditibacteriaceae bacterium]
MAAIVMMGQFIKNLKQANMLQKYVYSFLATLLFSSMTFAAPPTNLTSTQQKVLSAPLQKPYLWFASTDPKGRNQDYLVLNPGEKRVIPLAAGSLLRFWCTALAPNEISVSLENIVDIPLLANNKASVGSFYEKAYTLYPQSTKNVALQILDKTASLVVVNHSKEQNKFFYQASVRPMPLVAAPLYSGKELLISAFRKLDAGESMMVGDPGQLKGGIINEIRISSPDASPLPLQDLVMQIAPSNDAPVVQVPLSAFLGEFEHVLPGNTGLSHWDGKTLVIDWPMPTGKQDELSLKIQNTGQASCKVKVSLSFLQMDKPPAFLFCAHQGSANSATSQPFALAIVNGSGALVGVSADMGPQPSSPRRTFAFLEGNETISTDTKNFEGTGTEDFFNSAWYFPKTPYLHPYDGMTFHSDAPPRVAASRWMIDDAAPFKSNLTVTLAHGSNNSGSDLQYHWYVFWYQQQPVRFDIPEILHQSDLNVPDFKAPNVPVKAPNSSLVLALLRVVLYTAFFAAFIFIILVALTKYGQRK